MKTKLILLVILCVTSIARPQRNRQRELTGGMGIAFEHTPSVIEYLNYNFAQSNQLSNAFNSSIEGWLEYAFRYGENLKVGIEYSYNYFAYTNVNNIGFVYEFDKTVHSLTPLLYYVYDGNGFEFKLGGGIGYRYALVQEKIYQISTYTAKGFGLLLRAQGLTSLGYGFYANIGADLRYDYIGTASNSGGKLINDATELEVNLQNFIVGVRIGVSYLFN